jgi:hypothetical protein
MARYGPDVFDIQSRDRQIAVPAHRIERIEGEGDRRDCGPPLDLHAPCLLVALLSTERLVDARRVEHGGVEQ